MPTRGAHGPQEPIIDLSIVIPAKDEAASLAGLMEEIAGVMTHVDRIAEYEVILVDDGSTDGTWAAIEAACQRFGQVRGVRLRTNMGKAEALAVGLSEACGRIIATMDADGQDDPAELPHLLAKLDEGFDLVTGYKKVRKDPLHKRLPSKVFNRATGVVTGLKLNDHNSGLRVGYAEIYDIVPLYGELHRYVPALAHANGFKVTELAVNHRPRLHGHSKYGWERYTRGALDLLTVVSITRYDRRPSHLFGGFGLLFGFIGTLILLYLTGVWLFTDHAIGTRPLLQLGILLDILAVQLLGMGLIAELVINRTDDRRSTATPVTSYVNRAPAVSGSLPGAERDQQAAQ
ncbi:glycosyltransferase family 2 protein [Nocardioides sp.]|uniref:glycosyltransferase family 2 protein n=1 Tax=Nocardioides sp. TaxID=35761 RepID=UPI0026197095|nr:glycosyltransferase family 2 protein [Nocardioides sp.]